MSADDSATARGTTPKASLRWALLGLLVALAVASFGVAAFVVVDRGAGGDPFDKVASLRDPDPDPAAERERALAAARTFVQRFNTYGPDLLDESGAMPAYAEVGELMTAKFGAVFEGNVGYAEQIVQETGIDRVARVDSVGVSTIDEDSAELLVGGIVEFSYPDPEDPDERVPFEPLRFRYEVDLVKVDGEWLVDDLDDIDDGLPSFGEGSQPQTGTPGGTPSDAPSTPPADPSGSPSLEPSAEPSEEGEGQ